MADVKIRGQEPSVALLYLRDHELREGMELLYFAYRDFTGGADKVLQDYGFGRAHHRAIHFIAGHPGLTINQLLNILGITKQSLGRVLRDLVESGLVGQTRGETDRRQKHLRLTAKGEQLERKLTGALKARMTSAYREAGPEAVRGFRQVLLGLLDPETRAMIEEMTKDGP